MKIPLRYQNTEYDCGATSFINALAYLYDREEFPVPLLKAIYRYTLDVADETGVVGKGGTSTEHAALLAEYFVSFANKSDDFDIQCTLLTGEDVTLEAMRDCLDRGGVIVARCWQEAEHYVLITKLDEYFAYVFDPYYLDPETYLCDEDVAIVLFENFTHNRLVKLERLFGGTQKDFALLEDDRRTVILMNR